MKQSARHLASAAILIAVTSAISAVRADEIPPTNPMSGDEKAIKEGRSWYRNACSPCHGGRADGAEVLEVAVVNGAFLRHFAGSPCEASLV